MICLFTDNVGVLQLLLKEEFQQAGYDGYFLRDWYATSPYLYELGTPAKVYQCSNCGTIGMNF